MKHLGLFSKREVLLRHWNHHFPGLVLAVLIIGFSGQVAAQVPPAPVGFAQIAPYNGQVNLVWTPVAVATSYQITRADATITPTPSVVAYVSSSALTVTSGTPVFTDFQVTDGRSYLYSVAGINGLGTGPTVVITAIPYTLPNVVNPTVSQIHNNSVDLFWGIPLSTFPINYYNVYRQTTPGSNTAPIPVSTFFAASPTPIATTFTNSFSDQTASSTAPNFYAVVAIDTQAVPGIGAFPTASTNGVLAVSALAPVAPSLTGFIPVAGYGTATPGANTPTPGYGVSLSWTGALNSENVTNYTVYSNTTPIATVVVVPTPFPTYGYFDPKIIPGSSVNYSVVATNSNGSSTSNSVFEEIFGPAGISTVQVTPNATSDSVTVSWNPGTTGTYGMITKYEVFRGVSGVPVPYSTANPLVTPTATFTPTAFAVIQETPSRTPTVMAVDTIVNANGYTYWVQPIDAVGTGGSVGTMPTPQLNLAPTPVTNVTAAQVGGFNNKINVTWSGASPGFYGNITNYVIYHSINSGSPTAVATVNASRSSRNDYVDDFTGTDTAAYYVTAVDALGNTSDLSVLSNAVTVNAAQIAPQPPRALHSTFNGTTLTYSWLLNPAADSVTEYDVYGANYYPVVASQTPTFIILTLTPVITTTPPPNWTSSTFYVQAINLAGSSLPATLSAVMVPTYVVTAAVTPESGIGVSWNTTPNPGGTPYVDSWVIYRSSNVNTTPTSTTVGTSPTPTPIPINFYQPIATVSSSLSSYPDALVTPGTRYAYMVTGRSNNSFETPVAESPISVTGIAYPTVVTWPNQPSNLSANTGSSATTLYWAPNPTPDSVQSYTLWHNGAPVPTYTALPNPTMTAIFPETAGTTSSYQIVANNPGGASTPSNAVSVLAVPAITEVVSLSQPIALQTPGITLTPMVWISGLGYSTSVVDYTIYRSTSPSFSNSTTVTTLSSPTTVFSDPNYTTGFINYYKVVADNGAGVTANFTLSGLVGVNLWPNPPNNFLANAASNGVTLSWSAPATGSSPVTAYGIYKGTTSGGENPTPTVITSLGGPSIDSQVTPGVIYYYYMNSISSGLYGLPTSEHQVIPGPAPILNGVSSSGQNILTWSPVAVATSSPLTQYVVSKLALPTPGSTAVLTAPFVTSNLTTTAYTDTGIDFYHAYVYKVAPIGYSTPGVTIFGTYSNSVTLTSPAQGPTNVSAVSGDQVAQLRWNYQGSFVTYTYSVQRKLGTAPTSAFQTIATGITGLDYTDTGLLDKTLYNYQIVAFAPTPGLSASSSIFNALPAKPPVVDNPTLTLAQTQNGNTISWTPANSNPGDYVSATMYPLGGYHVYRSTDGGGTYTLLNPQGTTATTYIDQVSVINGATYQYLVRAYDAPPNVNTGDPNMIHESVYNSVVASPLSASTALDRNSIRPFRNLPGDAASVNIRFVVTNPGNVQIKVYSLSGVFIKKLVDQFFGIGVYGVGGNYPLSWDGRNTNGDLVASGVYLITTEMNGLQQISKIAVIK